MICIIFLLIIVFVFIGLIYINIHTKYKEEVEPSKIERIVVPDQNVILDDIDEVINDEDEKN